MHTLRSFFEEKEMAAPREGLEKEILQAVLTAKNQEMKHRLRIASVGIFSSLGALVFASLTFGKVLLESDFWNILALVFSDVTVAVNYGNDFLLSLLETFPASSIAAVLLPAFVFLMFLNIYFGIQKKHYSY